MTCTECENLLGAPSGRRRGSVRQHAEVVSHLDDCEGCRTRHRGWTLSTGLLRGLSSCIPSGDLQHAIRAALATATPVAEIACGDCESLLAGRETNDLTVEQLETLDVHLATCSACNRLSASLEGQPALLNALPPVPVAGALRAKIFRRIRSPECQPVAQLTCEQARPRTSLRLDGETSEELEVHLANCSACMQFALALETQIELLASAPPVEAPTTLRQQILARVAAYQQSVWLTMALALRRSRRATWAAGVALCALAFGSFGVLNNRPGNNAGPGVPSPSPRPLVSSRDTAATLAPTEAAPPAEDLSVAEDAEAAAVPVRSPATPANRHTDMIRVVRALAADAPSRTGPTSSPLDKRDEGPRVAPESAPAAPEPASVAERTPPDTERPTTSPATAPAVESSGAPREPSEATPGPSRAAPVPPGAPEPDRPRPPTTFVYVDESPDNAPTPGGFGAPVVAPPSVPATDTEIEAPPVQPRTRVVRDIPKPAERDLYAEIRRYADKKRRGTPADAGVEIDKNKTAKYSVMEWKF